MTAPSPAGFFASGSRGGPPKSAGNTEWAVMMAGEVRRVVTQASTWAPRSQQVHLGPSELGTTCDRQIVSKLLREPTTNHVTDPWPSVVGTAVHAWLADAYQLDNRRTGNRWITEHRVVPHPDHAGTADLYDVAQQALLDHKCLGETSMAKVRSADGPSRSYRAQLRLYARGYRNLGLPVARIGLIAYPRTGSSVDGVYVWEDPDPMDESLSDEVLADTARRKIMAGLVSAGHVSLDRVPRHPSGDNCYFCNFYRPEAARHPEVAGCPGTVITA